jgi:hypothetical protein
MPVAAEDLKWQLQVTDRLSGIETGLKDLTGQVSRQNGNVATALNRIASLEANELARSTAAAAVERATAPWHRWAERAAFLLVGILFVLMLFSADKVLKIFTH